MGQISVDSRHLKQENHRPTGRQEPHGAPRLCKEHSRFHLRCSRLLTGQGECQQTLLNEPIKPLKGED